MAKGISSVAMVEELGRAGMLGFFGAAGLPFSAVETAVDRLAGADFPCGFNLIHSPTNLTWKRPWPNCTSAREYVWWKRLLSWP